MTAQMAEVLWIDGQKHFMFSNPLEDHFTQTGIRPTFRMQSTACRRGYVGEWEVIEGSLYLCRLKGTLTDGQIVTVAALFPAELRPVLAQWFTGSIRVPLGKMVRYVRLGYGSVYEDELTLEFEQGLLKRKFRRNESLLRRLKFELKFHWKRVGRFFGGY
jgi:hypothetical protein